MTYKEAQDLYKKKYGMHVKGSYIADVLNSHGKTKRKAPNRKGNYKYPCPQAIKPKLEKILSELGML